MSQDLQYANPITLAADTYLFENSPDCVKVLDIRGHILAVNENGKCAMEIDDFSLVSGKLWKSLWPQQSHFDIDLALAAARRGEMGRFNAFCPTMRGISKWWEVLVTPVRKSDGSIGSFFAISRDVTTQHYATVEQERLVRELQLANDRMIDIFNHAPAFMCVMRGPAHVFEIVNDKYATLVGNRDLIGLTVRRALPELEGQGFFERLDAVYQSGEPFEGSNIPMLLRSTPGHPLEEHVRDFVYLPLKKADGHTTGVLVHGVDQTARSKAERALFESGDRYRKLVTQAGAGVVEADCDGIFTLVNQKFCDMLGYSEQELLGTRIIEVTAPSSLKDTHDAINRLRQDGVPFVVDNQYCHKDGTALWVTCSVSALHDPVGAYRGLVAIVVDISASKRVSEALRKSEDRYRTVFDTMDQGYCIIDMIFDTAGKPIDYRFLEMNRMFEKHMGLSNAINKTMKELVPDLDQFWFDTYGKVALTGIPTRFENEAVAMHRWFDVEATRVGEAGSYQVALFFRDITQRMQANRELKRHATRQEFQLQLTDLLRPLRNPDDVAPIVAKLLGEKLNLSRVFFIDIDDAGGTFVVQRDWAANDMPSIAGLRRQLTDFGFEIINSLRSGTMVLVENVSIDGRTASHAQSYASINVGAHASFPLIKGGKLVASLSLCSATPLHWTDEHITLAQDTLERTWAAIGSVQAQNALQVERDRSRSVLLGMSEGYVLLDQDWTIVEVNDEAARIARHPRIDLLNKNYWLASPDLVGTELEIFYRRIQSTGQSGAMDYLHTYTADEKRWIEIRGYPLKKNQLAIFLRDINDRKLTAQELQDTSRRKDDFLAMLAHELRNPLAPIGAAADLIQRAQLDPVELRETSEVIGRQVKHMTHLINDLLDVSRVNRGLVQLDKDLLQMTQLVNDAVEQVTPLIRARGHRLSLHQTPHATLVVGDKKRLVQVIANLLHNAAKYTPDGGDLRLTTEVCEARIIIELTDNGIGMTSDLASHAFELFAQAERTSDRASGGLGLGLALVKSLVELHGGSVSCDSAGLGRGSRFCVSLPRASDAAADGPQYLNRTGFAAQTESLHIMVVDDNADAARMLAMVLKNAGHRVTVEHGSHTALQRAKIDIPQVFLLDIGLPEMDGYELARRLRAQAETANATLIAITGYGQKQDKQNAFEAGFDHHLVKPVDVESLSEALAQLRNCRV